VLNDEGVAVILSVLCLAAGYRQQLPSAGFGIEPGPIALESLHQLHQPLKLQLLFGLRSDAGIDAGHRHILEPVASEVPMMRCEVIGMVPLVHDEHRCRPCAEMALLHPPPVPSTRFALCTLLLFKGVDLQSLQSKVLEWKRCGLG